MSLQSFRRIVLMSALVLGPGAVSAQGKITLPFPLTELEKRAKSDSNDASAHYNVSLGYWNAKRWDDAERELRAAIALEPRLALAHLALAYLPFARRERLWEDLANSGDKPDKALTDIVEQTNREYRHAFLIDPMVNLQIIAVTQRSYDVGFLRDALGENASLYFSGKVECLEARYDDCEGHLGHVIDAITSQAAPFNNPPTDAYWFHGLAAAHQKHFDVAVQSFTTLIDREQKAVKKVEEKGLIRSPLRSNEYRYFSAVFQHAAGNTVDAITRYREVLEKDLGIYMAHVRLADIFESQRDYAQAIAERRRAVAANPDDATLQMDLGITLGKSGSFAEAEKSLMLATDAMPRLTTAWFWLGLAREQLKKSAEAKVAFEKVVGLAPSRLQNLATTAKQHIATLP